AYRSSELEFALRQVGCRAMILSPAFKSSDYIGMLRSLIPELGSARAGRLMCEAFPRLQVLVQLSGGDIPGLLSFADLLAAGADACSGAALRAASQLAPDQRYIIQITSRTSAPPKSATLTHVNLANR